MTAKTRSSKGSAAANNRNTKRFRIGADEFGESSPNNASENPSTVLPASPRKIVEGGKFEHKNAAEAPAMLHARVLHVGVILRPGKSVKRTATINATPTARPSEPSKKFRALVKARTKRIVTMKLNAWLEAIVRRHPASQTTLDATTWAVSRMKGERLRRSSARPTAKRIPIAAKSGAVFRGACG
jgi:hypothetical protein